MGTIASAATSRTRDTTPVFDRFDHVSKTPYASIRFDSPHDDKG